MATIKFTTKDQFIAALEARRDFWAEQDRKAQAAYQKAIDGWLQDARARLRKALELSYDELKNQSLYFGSQPADPKFRLPQVEKLIRVLHTTTGKGFSVGSTGTWATAYYLLVGDPDARADV